MNKVLNFIGSIQEDCSLPDPDPPKVGRPPRRPSDPAPIRNRKKRGMYVPQDGVPEYYARLAAEVLKGKSPSAIAREAGLPISKICSLVRSQKFKRYMRDMQAEYECQLRDKIAKEWAQIIAETWAQPL